MAVSDLRQFFDPQHRRLIRLVAPDLGDALLPDFAVLHRDL
jgi:hypothetical protein